MIFVRIGKQDDALQRTGRIGSDGIAGIDRSDYSPSWCRIEKGVLVQEDRDFVHTGFDRDAWEEIAGSMLLH